MLLQTEDTGISFVKCKTFARVCNAHDDNKRNKNDDRSQIITSPELYISMLELHITVLLMFILHHARLLYHTVPNKRAAWEGRK